MAPRRPRQQHLTGATAPAAMVAVATAAVILLVAAAGPASAAAQDGGGLPVWVSVNVTWVGGGGNECGAAACNASAGQQWQAGYSCSNTPRFAEGVNFSDPLAALGYAPPAFVVDMVNVSLWGAMACDQSAALSLVALLQGQFVGPLAPPYGGGCDCANCVTGPYAVSTFGGPVASGWAGYQYQGGTNTLRLGYSYPSESTRWCASTATVALRVNRGPPTISSMVPALGPVGGSTRVYFLGQGFTQTQQINCTFAPMAPQAAAFDNSGSQLQIYCDSPPRTAGRAQVTLTVYDAASGQTSVLQAPSSFFYYQNPIATSLWPSRLSIAGGQTVTVVGSGFFEPSAYDLYSTGLLLCMFGPDTRPVEATYFNSTTLACVAPPGRGAQYLLLSWNGEQFLNTSLALDYGGRHRGTGGMAWLHTYIWVVVGGAAVVAAFLVALAIIVLLRFWPRRLARVSFAIGGPAGGKRDGLASLGEAAPILSAGGGGAEGNNKYGIRTIDLAELDVGERIGRGTHAEVYRGTWHGTVVAVKKLPMHFLTEDFLEDFMREAVLMKSLRHPNVLQFLGACPTPPDVCIVMEYMPRGSLYRIIHDDTLAMDWMLVKRMMLDTARGMNYLHKSNVLHRDLKSHNLLVDDHWKVKVCDFGLAKMLTATDFVKTLTACGTPCWAAPEVLRNQRYTEKADIYSFAIVLWECVTRSIPYQGMPPFQVVLAVGTQGRRPDIPPTTAPEVARLITDCWAEEPAARPAFDDIIRRLEAL